MRIFGLAALIAVATLSGPAMAQEAEAAGPLVILNTHQTLAHFGTVPVEGAPRTAWIWTLYRHAQSLGGTSYDASAALTEFDCAGGRTRVLKTEVYHGDSYLGVDQTPRDWRVPGAQTLGATNHELMCRPLTAVAWRNTHANHHAARARAEVIWGIEYPEASAPAGD